MPKIGSYFPFPIWKKNFISFLVIESDKALVNSNQTRSLTLAQPSLFSNYLLSSVVSQLSHILFWFNFHVWKFMQQLQFLYILTSFRQSYNFMACILCVFVCLNECECVCTCAHVCVWFNLKDEYDLKIDYLSKMHSFILT